MEFKWNYHITVKGAISQLYITLLNKTSRTKYRLQLFESFTPTSIPPQILQENEHARSNPLVVRGWGLSCSDSSTTFLLWAQTDPKHPGVPFLPSVPQWTDASSGSFSLSSPSDLVPCYKQGRWCRWGLSSKQPPADPPASFPGLL